MKYFSIVLSLLLTVCSFAFSQKTPATEKEKISYSIGASIAKNMQMQGVDIDVAMLTRGIKDIFGNKTTAMTDLEMETTMMNFGKTMSAKSDGRKKTEGGKNKKEGEAFLAANKNKPGVVALPSGLQYKILRMGTGAKPAAGQTVKCNYKGTLINGKEFDNSYKRGEPIEFPLNQVIKGWTEGLQLMPAGSKWQLFIPSYLAYGEGGTPAIGPNSTLIFEIELIEIK
jgi:FKBP-type peptidyl-prolyl cis-trans isomerase